MHFFTPLCNFHSLLSVSLSLPLLSVLSLPSLLPSALLPPSLSCVRPVSKSGVWGGFLDSDGVRRLTTAYPPFNYLSCETFGEGRLRGCFFQWDNIDAQCRTGRFGIFHCLYCVQFLFLSEY